MLYYILAVISIVGVIVSGLFFTKKQGKVKPYVIPEPKLLYVLGLWGLFYILAFSLEWLGHIIGIWIWTDTFFIFLHAAVWWASFLTVSLFFLSALNPNLRYILFLSWVLLFEYLQEALIHVVSHTPLLGTSFLTITIVMIIVSLVSFKALDIVFQLKLLKKA